MYIPKSIVSNTIIYIFSSIGSPGGGGGLLCVGAGGLGPANAMVTPKRHTNVIINLFAKIFIFI